MATAEELIKGAQDKMVKSVEHARSGFATVRTGRASASLLDRIEVDYYGTQTPLRQLSTINVPDPRMLSVQPFDPGSIKAIEKAIQESDLGLTPSNDGKRHLKELVDNGEVGADDEHRAENRVQELTDEHTKQIDELLKHKEAEVMEV